MLELSLVIISQIVFSLARILNVRYTANDDVVKTILTGLVVKGCWLVGSAIGIKSVYDKDWLIIFMYLFSGIIGEILAFRVKL